MVTLNLLYVQVFKLRRKSHSLLDDPRIISQWFKNGTNDDANYLKLKKMLLFFFSSDTFVFKQ